eukprot:Opistho-1_new@26323
MLGAGQIVEADQADIVGHAQAASMQGQGRAESHLVIGGKNGAEGLAAVDQPFNGHQPAFLEVLARHHQRRLVAHAGRLQCRPVAAQALGRIGVDRVAGDEGDLAMAQAQQMMGGQAGAFEVVEVQRIQAGCAQRAAGDDGRDVLGQAAQRLVGQPAVQDDLAVDAARAQGVDAALLFLDVPVPADEQGAVARLAEFFLDAAQGHAVEGAVDRLRDHAYAQGAAAGQAAGDRVGNEAQLGDRAVHRLALLGADHGRAVEDAGDRARRHAASLGHHAQRDLAAAALRARWRPVGGFACALLPMYSALI